MTWGVAGFGESSAAATVTGILGQAATDLCAALIAAEAAAFDAWCTVMDGRNPDQDAAAATQQPVHLAAEALRSACLADPAAAEDARRALQRQQAGGDDRTDAAVAAKRTKEDRDGIRRAWVTERYHIFTARDALTVGLGWPHRGELVTATTRDGTSGPGVYLYSNDTGNVCHIVWHKGRGRHDGSNMACWAPRLGGDPWGNADPAGGIELRVAAAPGRLLPVPMPRWPTREDVEGRTADRAPRDDAAPAGAQPEAGQRADLGGLQLQLDLFGGAA